MGRSDKKKVSRGPMPEKDLNVPSEEEGSSGDEEYDDQPGNKSVRIKL